MGVVFGPHARAHLAPTAQEAPTAGQEQPPRSAPAAQDEPHANELTLPFLQERMAALESDASQPEGVRAAALAEFHAALEALTRADTARTTTAHYRADVQAAPDRIAEVQAELARPPAQEQPLREPGKTLAELQDLRDAAAARSGEAEGALDRQQATVTRRAERSDANDAEVLTARTKLNALLTSLEEQAPAEQASAVIDATRKRVLAEIQETRASLDRLDAEQDRNLAELQLVQLQLDLARREAQAAEALKEAWDQVLRDARSQDAQLTAEKAGQARTDLSMRHPALGGLVTSVEGLSAELSGPEGVVASTNSTSEERIRLDKELNRVRASFADTLNRFRIAGSSQALGFFLRLEYDKLFDPRRLRLDSRQRRTLVAEAQYRSLVLRELRSHLGDVGSRAQGLATEAEPFPSATEKQAFIAAASELCTQERELVDSLIRNHESHAQILLKAEKSAEALIAVTNGFEEFIRSHILWQRSVDRPYALDAGVLLDGLLWALRGEQGDAAALLASLGQRWPLCLLVASLLGLTLMIRRKAMAQVVKLAPLVRSYRTDSLTHTRKVVLYTLLAALPLPAAAYGLSWLLEQTGADSVWRSSWGQVLGTLAGYLIPFSIFLSVLKKDGLAPAHLRWGEDTCRKLARLALVFLVPVCIVGTLQLVLQVWGETPYRDTTARFLFVTTCAFLATFLFRFLSPQGPVLGGFYSRNPETLVSRGGAWLRTLGVGVPALGLLLAILGYYFTARMVLRGVLQTLVLAASVVVIQSLAKRWQVFHRRRLAFETARKHREEQAAAGSQGETSEDESEVDIPTLDAQTRRLISSSGVAILVLGLLVVWSDTLPALRVLDRLQLLPTMEVTAEITMDTVWTDSNFSAVTPVVPPTDTAEPLGRAPAASAPTNIPIPGMPTSAARPPTAATEGEAYRLSAADVLSALVTLLVTVVVVRNGPALLELGVLTRFPLDAGARYAITTLVRYALTILGGSLTVKALGIGWSSVQWLAAALTFGLAFGLQEIFANFISGLILLLERPIRIGDTVTVGDLTGTVARIRTRATTILDFDNRERLIPNKSLITDEVTNWTLSNQVTRLIAPVGVAYGTDTRRVFELLLRAGHESPFVLGEPPPSVLFRGFGESSLDFSLRFYIANRDVWVEATNDIHLRINDLFRAAGVEIAFPQRDLHLRSSDVTLDPTRNGGKDFGLAQADSPQ